MCVRPVPRGGVSLGRGGGGFAPGGEIPQLCFSLKSRSGGRQRRGRLSCLHPAWRHRNQCCPSPLDVLPYSASEIAKISIKCQDRFSFDCQNVRPSIFLSFCLSFSWRLYFSAYLYYFLSEIVRMSRNCQYRFSFLVIIVLSSCAFLYIAIILSFNIILSYSIVLFFYSGFHNPNY